LEKHVFAKVRSAVLATALAVVAIAGACTPGGGSLSGAAGSSGAGTNGAGGNAGTGGPSCPNGSPCGGSVVGTWNVTSSCVTLSGALDTSLVGLDPRTCKTASISGSLQVSGTWTANANGTYMDATTTTGTATVLLEAGCLMLSGTTVRCDGISSPLTAVGFSEANCVDAPSGGGCVCNATINHTGSIGWMTLDPQASGNHTSSGNTLTLDGNANYAYCVSGSELTLTPQPTGFTASGTIKLQKSSTSGVGGTTGSGASGGTTGGGASGGTTGGGASGGTTGGGASGGTTGTAGRGGTSGTAGTGTAGRGGTTGTGGGGTTGTAGRGGTTGTAGTTGTGGGSVRADGPCDVYAAAGMPCAAAYSMVRALTKNYTGPMYQIRTGSSASNTGSGGTLKDIPMTADGYADTAMQDTLCSGTLCTVALLYDQTGNGNHLPVAKAGLTNGGANAGMDDFESSATKGSIMINGHKSYSLYMAAREGYRIMKVGNKVPTGSAAQSIYELADGNHSGTQCCWDFGNVTTNPKTYADMNTLFFGTAFWGKGAGAGPWFMADFEAGVWAGGAKIGDPGWGGLNDSHPVNNNNPSLKVNFAFGILKTQTSMWSLRMADLSTASALTTGWVGGMPKTISNAGAIVLGVGGDNSNNSFGTFYEGAIISGYASDATDLAVFQNVKAAGYGR